MPGRNIEFICGYHAVRQVLSRRPHDVLEIYGTENRRRSTRMAALQRFCADASISLQYISPLKLEKLTEVKNHQGIAAKCQKLSAEKQVTIADLCTSHARDNSIILVLDRIMDPHNLGACIRTADAAGVEAVVLPKDHSARLNATVRKVASGAAETTHIITVTNIARCLRQLREGGYQIIGAAGEAAESIFATSVHFPVVLVIGSEEAGMRQNTRNHCAQLAKIPMYGSVESLNLSVAAGICLYEIRRRVAETKKTFGHTQ